MIQDGGDRYVPFNPDVLNRMTWEQMIEESSRMEEQDNLWKQANAQNVVQLAGLFGKRDLLKQRDYQEYQNSTGESLLGNERKDSTEKESAAPSYERAVGGPNMQLTKSRAELRSQAEMMVRNGRLGTVKSAEEAIRQDWLSRGYIVK